MASYSVGGVDIAKRTEGFGLKTIEADGCDYHAVYDAMAELLDHSDQGMALVLQFLIQHGFLVTMKETRKITEKKMKLKTIGLTETVLKNSVKIILPTELLPSRVR